MAGTPINEAKAYMKQQAVEKGQEQLKYESTTLDEIFQEELDRLVTNHEKLTLARERISIALLSKTRKELAEMGLNFEPWNAMR